MKQKRSVYIKTPSGSSKRFPSHRVNRRSAQREIKQHKARNRLSQVHSHETQQRHAEFDFDDATYNCATSCNVIQIIEQDCSKGLFLALCLKCAICIRDLRLRMEENHRSRDEIASDEVAIYSPHSANVNNNRLELSNNRLKRYCFVPLETIDPWVTIQDRLNNVIPCKTIFEDHGLLPPVYSNNVGVWIKIQMPVTILSTYGATPNTNTLIKGTNTSTHHKCDLMIALDQGTLNTNWIRPLQRVQTCIEHVVVAFHTCRPTVAELDTVHIEVNTILNATRLPSIKWDRLADTFMGGLYKFTHDEVNVARELQLLKSIHYLKDMPRIRALLNEYINGIVNA